MKWNKNLCSPVIGIKLRHSFMSTYWIRFLNKGWIINDHLILLINHCLSLLLNWETVFFGKILNHWFYYRDLIVHTLVQFILFFAKSNCFKKICFVLFSYFFNVDWMVLMSLWLMELWQKLLKIVLVGSVNRIIIIQLLLNCIK